MNEKTRRAELPPKIVAFAERPSAVYRTGETVRFKIWLIQPKEQDAKDPEDPDGEEQLAGVEITYELTGDGNYRKQGSFVSGKGPATVEAVPDRPGFVLLKASARPEGGEIVRLAGAGVDPEKIVSGTEMPADLEAYWQDRIRKMRAKKPEITVRDITENCPRNYREAVKICDVRIADGTINATGILTVPRYPGREKMPAVITFGGASWLGARIRMDEAVARGAMIFSMNIHDTPNLGLTEAMEQQLRNRPDIRDYPYNDLLDREKYMPGKIFLRIVRSLDYLKSRPEWNGRDLIATGPSFGGCQSIAAAALDRDVTLCCPGGPAMCDHLGSRRGQIEGWPKLLVRYQDTPEQARLAAENSAYFDSANLVRLIRCPVVFSVGFIDTVCPPTSVYAAYNNVSGPDKRMIHATRAEHGDSYKPNEPGAFDAPFNPLYREICGGTELLVNGSFRYRDFEEEKAIPYGWRTDGEAVVSGSPEKDSCQVRLSAGSGIRQNVFNVLGTVCKVRLTGKIRGEGELTVRLEASGGPYVCRPDDGGGWTAFEHVFILPEGLRNRLLEIQAEGGALDVKELSLKY